MDQIIKRALRALPFAIALFDDAGGNDGGGNSNDGGANAGGQGGGGNNGGNVGGNHQRNDRGQFSRNDGDNDRGNRVYATDINEANRRIAELNEEAANRRRENKDLKKDLSTLQSRQSLVDQRAIRMEAREALRARGVIDPDVVDLFLKHAGDKVKIDENTGDVIGVDTAAEDFKTAKPQFFKPADDGGNNGGNGQGNGTGNGAGSGNGDGSGSGAGTGANGGGNGNDSRGNATGTGASIASGGTGGGNSHNVPDMRDKNVDADAAADAYMRSLR